MESIWNHVELYGKICNHMQSYGIMLAFNVLFCVSNPLSFLLDFDHCSLRDIESYLQHTHWPHFPCGGKVLRKACSFEDSSIIQVLGETEKTT